MFPSSVQEEEAHLRAAIRASTAAAAPPSARGSGVSERGARNRQTPRSLRDLSHLAAVHHERATRERASVLAATAELKRASRAQSSRRARYARVPAEHVHVPRTPPDAAFHHPANDDGTAFYPTRAFATVPGPGERSAFSARPREARPSASSASVARDGDAYAAQLDEALRRSEEEADLAEALRRSALETPTSTNARTKRDAEKKNPSSPRASSPTSAGTPTPSSRAFGTPKGPKDPKDPLPRRRGYGVSPPDARVSPATRAEVEARDVAAAAFRSAMSGAPRRAGAEREREREASDALDARARTFATPRQSAADSCAREALERAWAESAAAAKRERERAAAAADAEAREKRREARREAWRSERDAARRERERAAEAEAEASRLEASRRAAERETASASVARTIGRLDLPSALAAVGFPPGDKESAAAVRKAYRRAALRFHPDRTQRMSAAERVRGEEVWKALGSKMEAFERTA